MAKVIPLVLAAGLWKQVVSGDVVDETRLSSLTSTQTYLAATTDALARTALAAQIAGATIPGSLTLLPATNTSVIHAIQATGTGSASLAIRTASGVLARVTFGDGSTSRWDFAKLATANFGITRYNSSGVSQGVEFQIDATTGALSITRGMTVNGGTFVLNSATGVPAKITVASSSTQDASIDISSAAGQSSDLNFLAASIRRWRMGRNATNHDFAIDRYNSSGVYQTTPFGINYATDEATFSQPPKIGSFYISKWRNIGRASPVAQTAIIFDWPNTIQRLKLNYWNVGQTVSAGIGILFRVNGVADNATNDYYAGGVYYTFANAPTFITPQNVSYGPFIMSAAILASDARLRGEMDIFAGNANTGGLATMDNKCTYINSAPAHTCDEVHVMRQLAGYKNGIHIFAGAGTISGQFVLEGCE